MRFATELLCCVLLASSSAFAQAPEPVETTECSADSVRLCKGGRVCVSGRCEDSRPSVSLTTASFRLALIHDRLLTLESSRPSRAAGLLPTLFGALGELAAVGFSVIPLSGGGVSLIAGGIAAIPLVIGIITLIVNKRLGSRINTEQCQLRQEREALRGVTRQVDVDAASEALEWSRPSMVWPALVFGGGLAAQAIAIALAVLKMSVVAVVGVAVGGVLVATLGLTTLILNGKRNAQITRELGTRRQTGLDVSRTAPAPTLELARF